MKVFVLSIDGLGYSLLVQKMKENIFKTFISLVKGFQFKKINSTYPVVSSVAWTTYSTGKNPGEHGIFGFIDRTLSPLKLVIPTARNIKTKTIWQEISEKGEKVVVVNVPLTYPPTPVSGILVAGFLSPNLEKAVYPSSVVKILKDNSYIIDVDASVVTKSKSQFLSSLTLCMENRFKVAILLLKKYPWNYFHLHIMEVDRLLHFFQDELEEKGKYFSKITSFFQTLDYWVGVLLHELPPVDKLFILSDHGFCKITHEVQLNSWLIHHKLLSLEKEGKLFPYQKTTTCYSLLPGRIYLNLKGREERGSISPSQYSSLCSELKEKLKQITSPTGEKVIDRVFFRDEIYTGNNLNLAPDLLLHPHLGFDLKSTPSVGEVFTHTHIKGMHTYNDAFIIGKNIENITSLQEVKAVMLE